MLWGNKVVRNIKESAIKTSHNDLTLSSPITAYFITYLLRTSSVRLATVKWKN